MRLRHFSLGTNDLEAVTSAWGKVFDGKVVYQDLNNDKFGLRNAVIPAGRSFIEVLQPLKEGTAVGRFLERMGGDACYMMDIQIGNWTPAQTRLFQNGVRLVYVVDRSKAEIDPGDYFCVQLHPADLGGIFIALDVQRDAKNHLDDYGPWTPAGKAWHDDHDSQILDLQAVIISVPDPAALAQRWAKVLGVPMDGETQLALEMGRVEFLPCPAGARPRISGLRIKVRDVELVRERARRLGLLADDGTIRICGTDLAVVE